MYRARVSGCVLSLFLLVQALPAYSNRDFHPWFLFDSLITLFIFQSAVNGQLITSSNRVDGDDFTGVLFKTSDDLVRFKALSSEGCPNNAFISIPGALCIKEEAVKGLYLEQFSRVIHTMYPGSFCRRDDSLIPLNICTWENIQDSDSELCYATGSQYASKFITGWNEVLKSSPANNEPCTESYNYDFYFKMQAEDDRVCLKEIDFRRVTVAYDYSWHNQIHPDAYQEKGCTNFDKNSVIMDDFFKKNPDAVRDYFDKMNKELDGCNSIAHLEEDNLIGCLARIIQYISTSRFVIECYRLIGQLLFIVRVI